MRKSFVQVAVLALVGALAGIGFNAVSPKKLPLVQPEGKTFDNFRMVTTDEVKFYLSEQGARLVDARSPEEYSLGHIPGALCLPDDGFDTAFPPIQAQLKTAPFLIIYCSGGSCATSEHLAKKLAEKGIAGEKILIYGDGFPGWMRAKNPIESGLK